MRILKQLLSFVLVSFVAGSLASAAGYEAKVVKVTGDARAQLPGQSSPVAITEGMTLPQGAVITTGNGEVWLSGFPGATAAVSHNTSLRIGELGTDTEGKRKALLELSRGRVSSTLDPSKSSVTNYSVRTPKGVAAARGTVLQVSYEADARTGDDEMTVVALSGTVTVTLINSNNTTVTLSLPVGNAVTTGGGTATTNEGAPASVSLADAVASGLVSADDLKEVVQFVAAAVTGADSGYSDGAAQTLVETVVGSAVNAVGSGSTTATEIISTALSSVSGNSALSNAVTNGASGAGATQDQINSARTQAQSTQSPTPQGNQQNQTNQQDKQDNQQNSTLQNDRVDTILESPGGGE